MNILPLFECYESPQLKLFISMVESDLSGFICGLAGKCRSLNFSCSVSIYLWFTHIPPLVLFWFFIYWHHDSYGKERRALQIYWQQGWTENNLQAWEKSEISVMFIRLAESKSLLKPNPPWNLCIMTLQLRKENKVFGTTSFVGLA